MLSRQQQTLQTYAHGTCQGIGDGRRCGCQPTLTNTLNPLWPWATGILDKGAAERLMQKRGKVSPT